MLTTEMEERAISKAGTKTAGKKFVKAVRARWKDEEIKDLPKFGLVSAVDGLHAWSGDTGNFYLLEVKP